MSCFHVSQVSIIHSLADRAAVSSHFLHIVNKAAAEKARVFLWLGVTLSGYMLRNEVAGSHSILFLLFLSNFQTNFLIGCISVYPYH